MISTTLATVAFALSAATSPFSNLVHMHPKAPDTRVSVVITNESNRFQDVKIGDRSYTVFAHHSLNVKAPAGTKIVSDSNTGATKRGELILELKPQSQQRVVLN